MATVLIIRLLDEGVIAILVRGKLLIRIDRAVGVVILLMQDGSPQSDGEGFLECFPRGLLTALDVVSALLEKCGNKWP